MLTNYRHISLLPSISKIFEKVIYDQAYKYLQNQRLFYNAQYSFRTEHPSEYAALEIIDLVVITEMDNDKIHILDISNAFTTLITEFHIEKFNYYRIDGASHRLFESYLKEEKKNNTIC